jgi:hypothetical protein
MRNKVLYVACILLIMACEEKNDSFPGADQLVLFQREYINAAWGYAHSGFIVDSSGNLKPYKLPENWNYPDPEGYLSQADMNENFMQLGTVSSIIEKDLLLKYFGMLKGASKGKLSKPVNRMFDAGEITYSGFLYDSEKDRYRQVILRKDGDWVTENNSHEANEIYLWMKNLR